MSKLVSVLANFLRLAPDTSSPQTGSAAISGAFLTLGEIACASFIAPWGVKVHQEDPPSGLVTVRSVSVPLGGTELTTGNHTTQLCCADTIGNYTLPCSSVTVTIPPSNTQGLRLTWNDVSVDAGAYPSAILYFRDGLFVDFIDGTATSYDDNGSIPGDFPVPTNDGSGAIKAYGSVATRLLDMTPFGGGRISSGSGVPTKPGGIDPTSGDINFRTDTPSTLLQRLYICTVGGATPTWVGIL